MPDNREGFAWEMGQLLPIPKIVTEACTAAQWGPDKQLQGASPRALAGS